MPRSRKIQLLLGIALLSGATYGLAPSIAYAQVTVPWNYASPTVSFTRTVSSNGAYGSLIYDNTGVSAVNPFPSGTGGGVHTFTYALSSFASSGIGSYTFNGCDDRLSCPVNGSGQPTSPDFSFTLYYDGTNVTGYTNNQTRVISITSPALYATTTSPVPVTFALFNSASSTANAYKVNFVNTLSYQTTSYTGWLSGLGTYSISTSTPLTGDGTWKMQVSLLSMNTNTLTNDYSVVAYSSEQWFGLNYNDNVSISSSTGCVDTTATSTSCSINFLGTFSAGGCMEYLFTPSCQSKTQFGGLTLANSFPFAYVYQIKPMINAVFNSPMTASSTLAVTTPIGGITFLSTSMMEAVPFASLIKTLLSAVMWFMALMVIYRKVIKSHDNVTHV